MLEWLLAPIDAARPHEIDLATAWHARLMTLAWGILAPLAVLIARFFKVMPGQDWPREVDNRFWWHSHLAGQITVLGLSAIAFWLIVSASSGTRSLHSLLGYGVLLGLVIQVLLGAFRGSKGGPTDPRPDGSIEGDHYSMTPWRIAFEHAHKGIGYLTLLLAAGAILAGLWLANAPHWMWLGILGCWVAMGWAFMHLQRRGWAIDTYSAIWGDDPDHPGNQRPVPGWGMHRPRKGQSSDEAPALSTEALHKSGSN